MRAHADAGVNNTGSSMALAGDAGGQLGMLRTCFLLGLLFVAGFLLGFELREAATSGHLPGAGVGSGRGPGGHRSFITLVEHPSASDAAQPPPAQQATARSKASLKGDTIHAVHTSNGGDYQNYQSRIMYASYKLVQQDPWGDRLTGFTRVLHRTVSDYLMEEMPTFHAKPYKSCDDYCDYPVANRPHAIQAFFDAAAKDPSMIKGAWVLMLEADYVWMRPMQVPGSAWNPRAPGVEYLFDYIQPWHPNAVPSIKKMYPGPVRDVPESGPAPVLLRLRDWQKVVPDYVRLSVQMETDPDMVKALGWVREMYAWDAAVALHRGDVRIRTEHWPNSTTIVQPPFDESLGKACLTHYTWGALYHEGLPSKNAKQIYRWEKRDIGRLDHVLKIQKIPMPPDFRPGLFLEFDAPLTRVRHDLVVLQLAQMNRAIDTLPDLTAHYAAVKERIQQEIQEVRAREKQEASILRGRVK